MAFHSKIKAQFILLTHHHSKIQTDPPTFPLFSDLRIRSISSLFLFFPEEFSFEDLNTLNQLSAAEMAGAYSSLAPKTKNLVVAGGLTAFVFGVYFYTMKAVGGTDELQVAIDKFEEQKKQEVNASMGPKA
ncbi:hypothetical protein REPUB_Repub15cG0133900 [Reevesia pubescens]